MKNFNTVTEALDSYVSGVSTKANFKTGNMIARAICAGAMIAFGAEASNVAAHNIANVGIARLIAGCVFPVGLMMVILLGAELFTGDCMMTLGVANKSITLGKCIKMMCLVYIGNFIGGMLISTLTYFSGQYNYSDGLLGAYTIKVALGKVNLSFGTAIASGILCNILVCASVLMAICSTDITGKLFVSFFVILAFVVSGFEHCVANMYYIPAGLLCKLNPKYVEVAKEAYNLTAEQLDSLNWGAFFAKNLLPVTIGNIIGGAFLFGLPLFYIYRGKKADK